MAGEVIRESLPFVILLHFQTVTSGLRIIHSEKPTPNIDNKSLNSFNSKIYLFFVFFIFFAMLER